VTVYFQVRNMVDAASADAGALKDDHGHWSVRPGVKKDVRFHARDFPVFDSDLVRA
jgi:hypothetical protein